MPRVLARQVLSFEDFHMSADSTVSVKRASTLLADASKTFKEHSDVLFGTSTKERRKALSSVMLLGDLVI